VIIGGQMFSLLLALLVTPVTYSLLDSFTNLFRRRRAAPIPAAQAARKVPLETVEHVVTAS
jgi:HAE1 family hydrophobic/amphiphilic exporter-1